MKKNLTNLLIRVAKYSFAGYLMQFLAVGLILAEPGLYNNSQKELTVAQTRNISGTVTASDSKEPLPGVNVIEKGTTNGTVTDVNGTYSLSINEGATLVFSSVGYVSEEVTVGNRSTINLTLISDIKTLEELVVVGYGTALRKDVTTSISKVDPKGVPSAANAGINDLLVGRAAGLKASQASSQPGGRIDLSIRGRKENPLIIVDGIQMPYEALESGVNFNEINNVSRGGLAGINPNDIESIEILKDGAASMYGIGAAGGVIIITTKKGTEGSKVNVSYNGSHSIQKNLPYIEPLGPADYMRYYNRFEQDRYLGQNNMAPFGTVSPSGVPVTYTQEQINAVAGSAGTDWLGMVLRDGSIDNHSLSISGGTENVAYYFSGNFFNQVGTVQNSDMKKFNGRADLSFRLNKALRINTNIIANRDNFLNTVAGWQTGGAGANGFTALQAALSYPTHLPLRDESTGELTHWQLRGNPFGLLDIEDKTENNSLYANISLDIDIIPKTLKAKVLYGNNTDNSVRDFYIPSTTNWFDDYKARASLDYNKRQVQTMEAYATFEKNLGEMLNVNWIAGLGEYITDGNDFGLQASGMLDAINTSNVGAGPGTPLVNSGKYRDKKRSYFTRATLDFWDRYILSGSFRYDGFNQWFPGDKYAAFPSASMAWKISNESFLNGINNLDLLKLRASIGTLGNSEASSYAVYQPNASIVSFEGGGANFVPYLLTRFDQPLQWQKTINKTIGIDFGLFGNRISGSIDWFKEDVTRMLVEVNTPALSFIPRQYVNGRHQVRQGIELDLNTDNIKTSDFTWRSSINVSNYTFRWEERYKEDDIASYMGIKDPVDVIYAFETNGILQLNEEPSAWQPTNALKPGSPKFVDRNGDGVLDSADVKTYSVFPTVSIGFGNMVQYKNFDLTVFLYGQMGAYRRNYSLNWTDPLVMLAGESAGTQYMDMIWSSENPDGTLPGSTYSDGTLGTIGNVTGVGSDSRVMKSNFLRARNIMLGYTFNSPGIKRYISDLRLYFDVQNAFIISNYKGADPEVEARGVKGAPAPYPMVRTFSFGINANF